MKTKEEKQLLGALILCGIFLFLLCFIASHDYTLTKQYNTVVEDFNKCLSIHPNYQEVYVEALESPQWALGDGYKVMLE